MEYLATGVGFLIPICTGRDTNVLQVLEHAGRWSSGIQYQLLQALAEDTREQSFPSASDVPVCTENNPKASVMDLRKVNASARGRRHAAC